ncbi:MAG: peptidase E [Alicyclobacillus sp.]|nr:peptidase E [Alicyclobacillus sp.]
MRQIVAIGGGGFSMEPENPLLDQYVLRQTNRSNPKVCFIPTASGDAEGYIQKFYQSFNQFDCELSHLSLFNPHTTDLRSFVLEQHLLYVGGGNTRNLLVLWREWGLDDVLRSAWEAGVVLAGISAGAMCWFDEGLSDSYGPELDRLQCLGFLPGSMCPHYDSEPERRTLFHTLLEQGRIQPGFALDDGVALHYIDTTLHAVISSRPNKNAYRLSIQDNEVMEEAMTPVFLGV